MRASLGIVLVAAACGPWPTTFAYDQALDDAGAHEGDIDVFKQVPGPNGALRAGVLMIHGGSWNGGDKSQLGTQAARLAQEGYVVGNTNYRLSGQTVPVTYPVPLQDVWCALAYFRANAASFGLDPARVVVLGYSAGAYFSEMVGLNPASVAQSSACPNGVTAAPVGVIAGGAPSNLAHLCSSIKDTVGDCDGDLVEFLGVDAGTLYTTASPIANVVPGTPPFLLIQSSQDVFVGQDESIAMEGALQAAGDPVSLLLIAGGGHLLNAGVDLGSLDAPEYAIDTPEGWAAVLQFLNATVGSP